MTTWIAETADGEQVHLDHEPEPVDGEFARVAVADRDPCDRGTEYWDFDAACWVTAVDRALALVDQDHKREFGATAIRGAHWLKAIEATLITAGQPVPGGMIEAEAEIAGVEVADLAAIVLERHRAETLQPELERMAAKRALRDPQN
jgi:hypothetical protein